VFVVAPVFGWLADMLLLLGMQIFIQTIEARFPETAGMLLSNGSASSVTAAFPDARVGSERAAKAGAQTIRRRS